MAQFRKLAEHLCMLPLLPLCSGKAVAPAALPSGGKAPPGAEPPPPLTPLSVEEEEQADSHMAAEVHLHICMYGRVQRIHLHICMYGMAESSEYKDAWRRRYMGILS